MSEASFDEDSEFDSCVAMRELDDDDDGLEVDSRFWKVVRISEGKCEGFDDGLEVDSCVGMRDSFVVSEVKCEGLESE